MATNLLDTNKSLDDIVKEGRERPLTALGTESLGGGPDVSKMLGTPTEKQGRLTEQLQESAEEQTLDQQLRELRAKDAAKKRQKADETKIQSILEQTDLLADVKSKAADYAAQSFMKAAEELPDVLPTYDEQALANIKSTLGLAETDDLSELQGHLKDKQWKNAIDWIQTKTDYDPLAHNLRFLIPGVETSLLRIAENTATGFKPDTTIESIYADAEDADALSQILAEFGEDARGWTPAELQRNITTRALETTQLDELEDVLNDPYAGVNEKAEARRMLRELNASGQAQIDSKQRQAARDIIDDEEVFTLGDEEYTLGELMTDSVHQSAVIRALESEEAMEKLRETSPKWAEWIEDRREDLQEAYDGLSSVRKAMIANVNAIEALKTITDEATGNASTIADPLFAATAEGMPVGGEVSSTGVAKQPTPSLSSTVGMSKDEITSKFLASFKQPGTQKQSVPDIEPVKTPDWAMAVVDIYGVGSDNFNEINVHFGPLAARDPQLIGKILKKKIIRKWTGNGWKSVTESDADYRQRVKLLMQDARGAADTINKYLDIQALKKRSSTYKASAEEYANLLGWDAKKIKALKVDPWHIENALARVSVRDLLDGEGDPFQSVRDDIYNKYEKPKVVKYQNLINNPPNLDKPEGVHKYMKPEAVVLGYINSLQKAGIRVDLPPNFTNILYGIRGKGERAVRWHGLTPKPNPKKALSIVLELAKKAAAEKGSF